MKRPENTMGEYEACSLIRENYKHFEGSFEAQRWKLCVVRLNGSPTGILGMQMEEHSSQFIILMFFSLF